MKPILPSTNLVLELPLFGVSIAAGFPSPADDYIAQSLDLNQHLIAHPSATYFLRASGDSMKDVGIYSGDILIVDYSLQARHGDVVIAALDGSLTCKLLDTRKRCLRAANANYLPIDIGQAGVIIEGVVTASIRFHRKEG
jgi:DNA polymerase V